MCFIVGTASLTRLYLNVPTVFCLFVCFLLFILMLLVLFIFYYFLLCFCVYCESLCEDGFIKEQKHAPREVKSKTGRVIVELQGFSVTRLPWLPGSTHIVIQLFSSVDSSLL